MDRDFWLGLAAIPALLVVVALSWLVIVVVPPLVERLATACGLGHWSLKGPQWGRTTPAGEVFRRVNVQGRHIASIRRLVAVGPWTVYLGRYAPGHIETED